MRYFESLCACAVNVYVIISGYFLSKTYKRNLFKIIELLFQVIIISVIYYFISIIINKVEFNYKSLFFSCIIKNWFVVLYVVLYIISPYINIIIDKLDKNSYFKLLIILFVIFSIYPTFMDLFESKLNLNILGLSTIGMYGSQFGYTIVDFVLLYFIAGFIKKFNISLNKIFTLIGIIVSSLIILLWSYIDDITAWSYCNPFIIIESIMCFLLFKNLNVGNSSIINTISKASFMVYLTHGYFLFLINNSFDNAFELMTIVFILSIVIYLIGFVFYLIYNLIFGWLSKKLSREKIFNFEPIKNNESYI